MIDDYRIAINLEWTSRCNARCSMCPRSGMAGGQNMDLGVLDKALERINTHDVSRCVIAGFGEPTVHPDFEVFLDRVAESDVRFDMATNGELLTRERLERIEARLGLLMISFSSIVPNVYGDVHRFLDHDRVIENILLASRVLKKTTLAISLSPVPAALETLDETVAWFRRNGIHNLTMSPTLYNRGGASSGEMEVSTEVLRGLIRKHGLHSQELDFVTGIRDFAGQWLNNRFKCVARNSDLLISAAGDYLYCFNDINHSKALGNVEDLGIRQALKIREKSEPSRSLCSNCNLRHRYGALEILEVAMKYDGNRLRAT